MLALMAKDAAVAVLAYLVFFSPVDLLSDTASIMGLAATQLSTRPPAKPEPFFSSSSWVDDYFAGDIYAAMQEAQAFPAGALILFYAPWDADSISARDEMEAVSMAFEDHTGLYFAAVNCWTSAGRCYADFGGGKASNPRPELLPIFVFYPPDGRGVKYYGPVAAPALTQFLLNAQRPLEPIASAADLVTLRAASTGGGALVGYFPNLFPPRQNGKVEANFRNFLSAAYELLEYDPFRREVGHLAVVTSPDVAFQLHLNRNQPVRYFAWNSTGPADSTVYPNKTITSADALFRWAASTADVHPRLVSWTGAVGKKSKFLSSRFLAGGGHSLLVFTPRRLDHHYDETAGLVRETSALYRRCDINSTDTLSEVMYARRRAAALDLDARLARCAADPWFVRRFCRERQGGEACVCDPGRAGNHTARVVSFSTLADDQQERPMRLKRAVGFSQQPLYDVLVHNSLVSHWRLGCALAAVDPSTCALSNGEKNMWEEQPLNGREGISVEGLACADNRTLNFYLFDSVTQYSLARRLGLDLNAHGTAAVIVDVHGEVAHVLDGDVTASSLESFIRDFHLNRKNLKRLRLSPKLSPRPSRDESETTKKDKIKSLSALDFESSVNQPNCSVVLLYTSRTCGVCPAVAHAFHSVRLLLDPVSAAVDFAVVDSAVNDLPWQFTALSTPSVLFFPPGDTVGKAESRAFPAEKAFNVTNLLSFVLANLPKEERLKLSMSLCDDDCLLASRVEISRRIMQSVKADSSLSTLDEFLMKEQSRRGLTPPRDEKEPEWTANAALNAPFMARTEL